jgi:hypothetical protein
MTACGLCLGQAPPKLGPGFGRTPGDVRMQGNRVKGASGLRGRGGAEGI